ncbi:hypothetical protein ACHAWF_006790 [Thalassiosira exigua]
MALPHPQRLDSLVEIGERLKAMREQEVKHYAVPDYLAPEWQARLRDAMGPGGAEAGSSSSSSPPTPAAASPLDQGAASHGGSNSTGSSQINELWREKISEWCYQVVDHFDFNREVVSVALSYLDRYLAGRTVNRRIFQLAAMTALYLAIKLFEPGRLRMSSLIDLSRGYFLAEHLVTMEDSMLQSLGWHVHPPTSFAFCRDFVRLLPPEVPPRARHDVTELARFLTELSVCEYWFVTKRPSSVALASIINAVEIQGHSPHVRAQFLKHASALLGAEVAGDPEVRQCYDHLKAMYDLGGYAPAAEDDVNDVENEIGASARGVDGRVDTVSPTGVADGPDARDQEQGGEDEDDLSQMECA